MRITEIPSHHRNDFCADMVCEHCGATQKLTTGYNDDYYHNTVIPAISCPVCTKDRAGVPEGAKNEA